MEPTTAAVLMLFLAGAVPVGPVDGCAAFSIEVPVEHALASASTVPNLLRLPESVKVESHRMLIESERLAPQIEPPRDPCPVQCKLADTPEIVFRSTPAAVLESYDDAGKCERMLDRTRRQPLRFEDREFDSVNELSDWVGLFTRGKGEDGETLYRLCDGQCSPNYVWIISREPGRLIVDTEVTCGHARDRGNNQYDLSYSLRWTCR